MNFNTLTNPCQVYGHRDSLSALAIVLAMWLGFRFLVLRVQQSNHPEICLKETWKMRLWWDGGSMYDFSVWEDIFRFQRAYFCATWLVWIFYCFKMKVDFHPKDDLWRLLPTLMILEHGDGSLVTAAIYSCFLAKHRPRTWLNDEGAACWWEGVHFV